MEPVTDRALWGVVVIALTLIALAWGVMYASAPSDDRHTDRDLSELRVPVDTEKGYTYTCHCYRDPVRVTIRTTRAHRVGHADGAPGAGGWWTG
ncbi:hypothetical protein ACFXKS_10015 [Streptomyces scopuliridis]|uniref:hypothetical protein n=1 Tax=Streptomyces scopuliridis TaxID=452529 RepID=UPI0036765F51